VAFHTTIDLSDNPEVKLINISPLTLCIAVGRRHPLAVRDTLCISDLKDEPFYEITSKESPGSVAKVLSECRSAGFEPKSIKEFHNVSSLGMALRYKGVSLTMRESLEEFKDDLKFYPVWTDPREYIALAYPAKGAGESAKKFVKEIKEELKALS